MSQQVLKQVDKIYVSFFNGLKSIKNKGKHIHIPKYKDKTSGRNIAVYTNQTFKLKDGVLYLKYKDKKYIEFKTDKKDIQQVRLVPKGNHYVVEIIYNVNYELKENNNRYASIDLGLNNICTLVSNVVQSVIYNGRPLKSINRYYNKKKAEMQSLLAKNHHTSKRINHLTYRRNNKTKDYLHKISSSIIKYMETNNLNTLIVGKNIGWKDSINIGRVNNQNFVYIPYNILLQMLKYKCKLNGIHYIETEESYTSKCSFLDNENICKHDTYQGKREKRGLFITNKGIKINADINGAFNILRKGIESLNVKLDVLSSVLIPENKRFVYNPVTITI